MPKNPTLPPKWPRSGITFHYFFILSEPQLGSALQLCQLMIYGFNLYWPGINRFIRPSKQNILQSTFKQALDQRPTKFHLKHILETF